MPKKGDVIKGYRIISRLGKGGFGSIFLVESVSSPSEQLAMKVLEGVVLNDEVNIGLKLGQKCPYLVRFKDVFTEDEEFCIVMEFCGGGDLARHIQNGPLTDVEIYRFLYESAIAIKTLHDSCIIHRDIKPSNFFLVSDGGFKLGDYGTARIVVESTRNMTHAGTDGYICPEILRGEGTYTEKADIYSWGVTLMEVILGFNPYRMPNGGINLQMAMNGTPVEAACTHPHPIMQLARRMISVNPDMRPSVDEVLAFSAALLVPMHSMCVLCAAATRERDAAVKEAEALRKERDALLAEREGGGSGGGGGVVAGAGVGAVEETSAVKEKDTAKVGSDSTPAKQPSAVEEFIGEMVQAHMDHSYTIDRFKADFRDAVERAPTLSEINLFLRLCRFRGAQEAQLNAGEPPRAQSMPVPSLSLSSSAPLLSFSSSPAFPSPSSPSSPALHLTLPAPASSRSVPNAVSGGVRASPYRMGPPVLPPIPPLPPVPPLLPQPNAYGMVSGRGRGGGGGIRYTCDECGKDIKPSEKRFHCNVCDNFDLCVSCHTRAEFPLNRHHTRNHPMQFYARSDDDTLNVGVRSISGSNNLNNNSRSNNKNNSTYNTQTTRTPNTPGIPGLFASMGGVMGRMSGMMGMMGRGGMGGTGGFMEGLDELEDGGGGGKVGIHGRPDPLHSSRIRNNMTYICDECESRIAPERTRYHCTICKNFDLCEECHNKNEFPRNPRHNRAHPLDTVPGVDDDDDGVYNF